MHEHLPTQVTPAALKAIKGAHTIAWAFFAGCILAIPYVSWRGEHRAAAWLAAIVSVEAAVLVLNNGVVRSLQWQLDIRTIGGKTSTYLLPEWLAKHNKLIFGALYFAGVVRARTVGAPLKATDELLGKRTSMADGDRHAVRSWPLPERRRSSLRARQA